MSLPKLIFVFIFDMVVYIYNSHFSLRFRVAHPPWSQLTCLSVIMPDCKFLQEILPGAMSLVTLELYDVLSCYDTAITTISLPNLRRLTFEAVHLRAPNRFFPYVTFPSLDSLNISYCSSAQAMAWPIKPTYRSQKIVMLSEADLHELCTHSTWWNMGAVRVDPWSSFTRAAGVFKPNIRWNFDFLPSRTWCI